MFVALVSEDELHNVIANGRHGTLMPAWCDSTGGPLTDEQVGVLVKGIKQRSWKTIAASEIGKRAEDVSECTAATSRQRHQREMAQAGEKRFSLRLRDCHGENGSRRRMSEIVNDQAFLALVERSGPAALHHHGPARFGDAELCRPKGRGKATFKPLTSQQVSDLVALLASWRNQRRTRKTKQFNLS